MPTEEDILYYYRAQPIRIIDGDTFEAIVDLGFGMTVQPAGRFDLGQFRLYGIDTPETKYRRSGLTDSEWEAEKAAGMKATEQLTYLLHGDLQAEVCTRCWIKTSKPDKYGRWLATVWTKIEDVGDVNKSINKRMVDEGFAKLYESEPLK